MLLEKIQQNNSTLRHFLRTHERNLNVIHKKKHTMPKKKNNKDLYMRGIKRHFNKMFKNDT